MDTIYTGQTAVDGEKYDTNELHESGKVERRPFKAVLDVGLAITSKGARVFGVLKGATDGGIFVPHSVKNFPGYSQKEDEASKYEAGKHRDRIFGKHIDSYFKLL